MVGGGLGFPESLPKEVAVGLMAVPGTGCGDSSCTRGVFEGLLG